MAQKPLIGKLSLMRSDVLVSGFGLVLFALFVGGCPKSGPAPKDGKGQSIKSGSSARDEHPPAPVSKPGEMGFAPCAERPCMFHVGTATYHECHAAADGQCFHYGTTCEPTSTCWFDPQSKSYRSCQSSKEGVCVSYGATCAPKSGCMIDVAEQRYRQCKEIQDGKCKSFGDLCEPSI